MKITIVGTGYVGITNAVLLAQYNQAVALNRPGFEEAPTLEKMKA